MTPLRGRMAAPVAVGLAAACGCAVLWAVDPNEPGHYPVCPTRLLLGVDCPGCGMLRGTHALLHGDLAAAVDFNILLVVVLPLAAWWWARWTRSSWTGRSRTPMSGRREGLLITVALVALLGFGVLRNFVPYLSSSA